MELIKGRKNRRSRVQDEERFRFPAIEEVWETSCLEDREYEEREVQPVARKRRDFPLAS
jgi:hypothetical protein